MVCFSVGALQQQTITCYLSCRRQSWSIGLSSVEAAAVRLEPLEDAACVDMRTLICSCVFGLRTRTVGESEGMSCRSKQPGTVSVRQQWTHTHLKM